MTNKISWFTLFGLFLGCMLYMPLANAFSGLIGPVSSTTGSYTLTSASSLCSQSAIRYKLLENGYFIQSGCNIAKSFSAKPSGTYAYVLQECEYEPDFRREFCVGGDVHTVVVSAGGGGENPNGDNVIRIGDGNNDGRLDIFVDAVTSAPYLLRQLNNRHFQLISGLSASQLNVYNNWPLVTEILVAQSDFNADGSDDLMLSGVSTYIAGADNMVIYSSSNSFSTAPPASVATLTASKRQFLLETLGLSQDPSYLLRTMIEQGAYSQTSHGFAYGYFNTTYLQIFQMAYNGSVYVGSDENPYDDSHAPQGCATYQCRFDVSGGQWQMYVFAEVIETVFDYSIFDAKTVVLANEIDKVQAGTATLDSLLNVFKNVLGPISCEGITTEQVDVFDYIHDFNYFKTNTCTFAVLARYLNGFSIKDIINQGNQRLQFRARKIRQEWWKPFYHASINNYLKEEWLSGMPNPNYKKLIGHENHGGDDPTMTLIVGFVTANQNPQTVFAKLSAANTFYDNGLDYARAPLPYTSSYNSNSYAQGLVNLVGTIVPIGPLGVPGMSDTIDISINNFWFFGIAKPVPASEFGF